MILRIFSSKVIENKLSQQVRKNTEFMNQKIIKIKVSLLITVGQIKKEKKVPENFTPQTLLDATKEVFKEKRKCKKLLLKLSSTQQFRQ